MKAPATGQMHCQSLFLTNNGAYWRTLRSGSHRAHVQKINRGGKSSCLCYRTRLQLLVKAVCVSEKCYINLQTPDSHKSPRDEFVIVSPWCMSANAEHASQVKKTNKQTTFSYFTHVWAKHAATRPFRLKGCFILQFQYKRSARRQESKTKSTFRNAVIEFFIFYIVKTCSSTTIQTHATVRFC